MSTAERPVDPVEDVASGPGIVDDQRTRWYRNERFLYRIVAVVTVAPILFAAVRAGLNGWVPTFDSANAVMQARFSLSFHPSLIGIYTDASNWIQTATYFPGPWWLWWMAIPMRVLGPTWGPLLSMGVLNSLWILLAGWSVKRRLGYRAAMAALVFLGALTWSLGIAALYSSVSQVMIVPTFAAFFFIAWALAAGDEGVLPALALITNFILLDEVVLVRLVPMIAGAALVIWAVGLVHARRQHPDRWGALRRRTLRASAGAAVITVVMWVPPLIQQFTNQPGNLTNLWRARAANPATSAIWSPAYEVLISFFAGPPFWLRGSRTSNFLFYSPPPSATVQLITGLALLLLTIALGVRAARRRDRPALSAVVLGAVVFVAAWYNLAHLAEPIGAPTLVGHYLSTWAVAMSITFALIYGLVRALPDWTPNARPIILMGFAAVLAVLNLPHANITVGSYEPTDQMIEAARTVNPAIVAAVRDKGRVAVAAPNMLTNPFVTSVAVALHDAGIPFCIGGIAQWTNLGIPQCTDHPADATVSFTVHTTTSTPEPGKTVIARYDPLTAEERRELESLDRRVRSAADSVSHLEPTVEYRNNIRSAFPAGPLRRNLMSPEIFDTAGGPMASSITRGQLATALTHGTPGQGDAMLIQLPGISDDDLLRWAELESTRYSYALVVTLEDRRR